MFGTYKEEDVQILLKDVTGKLEALGTEEREKYIQSGRHYSEMLPLEYKPSEEYMSVYRRGLLENAELTARAVARVCHQLVQAKGEQITLVSLARAGTSIGVLLKRYLKIYFSLDVEHYTISIIRGRGIDQNAMRYILERHSAQSIVFVDGWTGKGAILGQLKDAVKEFPLVSADLAVLSDPAHIACFYGTREDFLIASSCLNSIVSGLLSRTILREDLIGERDFHGVVFYPELLSEDLTYDFIDTIAGHFSSIDSLPSEKREGDHSGLSEVKRIQEEFGIEDIHLIKPSIGEATRVLLRRIPWKLLVASLDDPSLMHLYKLAQEKGIELQLYPLKNYKACGIIRSLKDI